MVIRTPFTPLADRIAGATALDAPNDAIAAWSARSPLPRPPTFVHPRLVLVPIVAWGSAKLFDLVRDRSAAQAMVGLGTLAALPTAITGHEDWLHSSPEVRRVASVHAAVNNLVIAAYAASWLVRRSGHHRAGVALAWTGAYLLAVGIALGLDADQRAAAGLT